MKTIDRLRQFIDYKQLSYGGFDTAIGAGKGYIGKLLKSNGAIGSDKMEKIFSIWPELNPTWLFTGVGEMLKGADFEYLPPDRSGVFVDENVPYQQTPQTLQGKNQNKNVSPTVSPTILLSPKIITVDRTGRENIVHVPVRAQAGYLNGYGDEEYIQQLPSYNLPGLTDGTYRSFEVDGDSMYPTLKNRQLVIGQWVEKLEYIREDRVHILVTKTDGVIIKRLLNRIDKYGVIIAKSDATDERNLYPNLQIKPEDVREIWYGVWHGGFDFSAPTDMWRRVNNHEADLTVLQQTVADLKAVITNAGLLGK